MLAPIANLLSRAVYSKVPVTKRLFPATIQVTDPHRSFRCPKDDECQNHCWIPAACLKRHLMDVHQMQDMAAEIVTNDIRLASRRQSNVTIKEKALEAVSQVESTIHERQAPLVSEQIHVRLAFVNCRCCSLVVRHRRRHTTTGTLSTHTRSRLSFILASQTANLSIVHRVQTTYSCEHMFKSCFLFFLFV
jgi:hypothetical protein